MFPWAELIPLFPNLAVLLQVNLYFSLWIFAAPCCLLDVTTLSWFHAPACQERSRDLGVDKSSSGITNQLIKVQNQSFANRKFLILNFSCPLPQQGKFRCVAQIDLLKSIWLVSCRTQGGSDRLPRPPHPPPPPLSETGCDVNTLQTFPSPPFFQKRVDLQPSAHRWGENTEEVEKKR